MNDQINCSSRPRAEGNRSATEGGGGGGCCCLPHDVTWKKGKILSQETVQQNRINLAVREKVPNSH